MNSKKAKALRKMMRNMKAQLPDLPERQLLEDTAKSRSVIVTKEELEEAGINPKLFEVEVTEMSTDSSESPAPKTIHKIKTVTGQISNDPKSRRGLYRYFKKSLEVSE